MKNFKIPKVTLTGGGAAEVIASKAIPFGQMLYFKVKLRIKDVTTEENGLHFISGVIKNAPAAVAGSGIAPSNGGSGYSNNTAVATTGGSGTGLTVDTTTSGGVITSFTVNAGGVGYEPGDVITISGGNGDAIYRLVAADLTSTSIVGTNDAVKFEDAAYTVTVTANDTLKTLEVKATPAAADTIFEGVLEVEQFTDIPV